MNVDVSLEADTWIIPCLALFCHKMSLLGSIFSLSENSGGLVLGHPLVYAGTHLHSALNSLHAGLPLIAVASPSGEMLLLLSLIEWMLSLLDLWLWKMLLITSKF